MEKIYLEAVDVAEMLGISKSHAYKIMKQLNNELKKQGYITISGKVNRKYFMKKLCYGEMDGKE